jgi:hypothetical protein
MTIYDYDDRLFDNGGCLCGSWDGVQSRTNITIMAIFLVLQGAAALFEKAATHYNSTVWWPPYGLSHCHEVSE